MDRRSFLASLLATAVLDPERLLWVPGKTTIFIPPPVQPIEFKKWRLRFDVTGNAIVHVRDRDGGLLASRRVDAGEHVIPLAPVIVDVRRLSLYVMPESPFSKTIKFDASIEQQIS